MWEILLVLSASLAVAVASRYVYERRISASILLGLVVGIVLLVILNPSATADLPGVGEVSRKALLQVMIAIALAFATYLALRHPTETQVVINKPTRQQ